MIRKTIKIAACLAVGAMSMAGLAACGSSSSSGSSDSSGKVTLNLLVPSYSDGTKALWEKIDSGFQKAHSDIAINLQVESWDNINDVIRQNIQAGKTPDILNIDSFTDFAKENLLYKAADVTSPETLQNVEESFARNASMDGTQWALPLFASTRALFYNTDLFQKAGISNPPKTWDELEADALKIKGLGLDGVDGYGMPLGNEEAQGETAIWAFGAGGSFGDQNKITINSPQNLEGVTRMAKLVKEGATEANPGSADRTPLIDTFIQGKLGMVMGLPQTKQQIQEKNPKLAYAIAAIPTKDGSPMTLGVADHLMAFDNGDDAKKAAITKFFDYFYSDDVYTDFVKTLGFLPVTKTASQAMKDDELIAEFLPQLPDAKFYPFTNPNWQTAQGLIQSTIGKIATDDPKTVLDSIQKQSDQS
ncbi:MAG: extracellular solute-binding protein [Actinomycetaceae bacterium]|nr:extracellular solute-binding protein [Actinomycetaceae bacterium]MDY6082787.1 extracellular solute-binding protein [Actinomycetaceae bacterium]